MPEGPEIRLAADQLEKALKNEVVQEIFFAFEHLKHHQEKLTNQRISAVETRGKALLTRFENGWNIYSHNQLYGKWMVRKPYQFPATKRQLRLAIHNEKRSALLYSASDIEVLHDGEVADHPFISKLGPDLLVNTTTAEMVMERFLSKRFRRRRFPSLLLDQHFVAGLGNYLRTEALFVARLHPKQRPVDVSAESIANLAAACVNLTRQSYRTKGITTDLKFAEELKSAGFSRRDYRWWVFGREGQPCFVCHTTIIKTEMGGRRIYYCPTCQPSPEK